MSFVDRLFPDITRDILTNLTQGVTGESHRVDYDATARPPVVPDIVLERRPVRRVSFVQGLIAAAKAGDPPTPYVFTLNDYELVPNPQDTTDLNTLRFLPFGKKPAPGTDVLVNYYPRTTDPTPLTDLNVGSVVRTLVEAMSKELAILYTQLNLAYDSGFVDTATGSSLDRVVALLGYSRFLAGRPVGSVRFSRRAGSPGSITIPAGTPVTDAEDKIRYETIETRDMLPNESTAEVRVRGAADSTPVVDAGKLTVIQRAIAGIDTVVNERPTTRASGDESDEELRARAKAALLASNKGTVDAIQNGLLLLPEVRDVKITEMPNGVPGEVQLSISLVQPPSGNALPPSVEERIRQLRPAGIRVISGLAGSIALSAQVNLVLAGSFFSATDIADIHSGAVNTLTQGIAKSGVGQKIRLKPLVAALLADQRIVDATLTIGQKGEPAPAEGADFSPPADGFVQLDSADVAFGTDTYDKPPAATGQAVPVEVRATFKISLITGVSVDTARTQLQSRLSAFFSSLTVGTDVNQASILAALRDDGKYAIDPTPTLITLTSDTQFVQVSQSGQVFHVQPGQTFSVSSVEVNT